MEKVNYPKIYAKLTKGLSPKTREIFERRFGIKTGNPETLESIGSSYKITRERVRQIEEAGFNSVRKQHGELLNKVFVDFATYIESQGGAKREDLILQELGGKKHQAYVLFLLTMGEQFSRVCEKKDFYSFWSVMQEAQTRVKENLAQLSDFMAKQPGPVTREEFVAKFASENQLPVEKTVSFLEISKKIQQNKEGSVGLAHWPEIKPRGVRDKAFLVFKKHGKPLHFTDVAKKIDEFEYNAPNKKTFPQTVHNELIKDTRFVLVGRGTYALSEWGYTPGTIKDIIVKVLKENSQPINKDELVDKVLSQRFVAKNTVLMNLNNKKFFSRDEQGNYFLKGAKIQTA